MQKLQIYGGEVNTSDTSDWARSFAEMVMVEVAINKGVPIMGLCGGHQIINIYFGGKIETLGDQDAHQDLHNNHNAVIVEPTSELAAIIKKNTNIPITQEVPNQHFWSTHLDVVKEIGGKELINKHPLVKTLDNITENKKPHKSPAEDLLKVVAITEDKAIEATESQFGAPIITFQFHPEMTEEDQGPKINFSIEIILRDRKIFALFIKSAEVCANKREVIKEIKNLDIKKFTSSKEESQPPQPQVLPYSSSFQR